MIKWIRAAWQQHRDWGWVAELDEAGIMRPASPRRRRRIAARAELARRAA
jgi:hypothetical protein